MKNVYKITGIISFFFSIILQTLPISAQTSPKVLPAQLLNPDGYSDIGSDINPSVAYNGNRVLIAVWASNESTLNFEFNIYYH